MTGGVALGVLVASVLGWGGRPGFIAAGGDPSPGLLLNVAQGARPFDPPDPSRAAIVFVHGLNPVPKAIHYTMAEQLGAVIARRGGLGLNVLSWDWNGATFSGLSPRGNTETAVAQGRLLAAALRATGVPPSRMHLIGQSSGAIVVASAARCLATEYVQPVAQLTLLDPAGYYHAEVFERLAAGTAAPVVENYWAPGPSGFGRMVPYAGVRNVRVDGPSPYLGIVSPSRSNHLFVVRWYLDSAADPSYPSGFNTSVLLSPPFSRTPGATASLGPPGADAPRRRQARDIRTRSR